MRSLVRGNIGKIYVANLLTGIVFWYGVEKLFMRSIGIDAFGVSVNAIVLTAAVMVLDVPTGVLADRWSRKYTLVAGVAALGVSSTILGLSHNLTVYVFGSVLYGAYLALTSGTFQAIMYDSLAERGRAQEYAKHQGGSYGLFMIGIALSSLLGGFMAHVFGYRATYLMSAAVCVLNIAVLLSLHEPKFHKVETDVRMWRHIRLGAKTIIGSNGLLFLASVIIVAGLLRNTMNEYAGLYFIALGFGTIGSGAANAGKWLAGSLGLFVSGQLRTALPALTLTFFGAFAVFSWWRSTLGLIFFFAATLTHAIVQNETQSQLQHQLDSSLRATTLSLLNFASTCSFCHLA